MAAMTREDLVSERDECKERLRAIDAEHAGERFSAEVKEEWNRLNTEVDEYDERIDELDVRVERLRKLSEEPAAQERTIEPDRRQRNMSRLPDNIWDLHEYRVRADSPEDLAKSYRDGALKAIEQAEFPHERARKEDVQGHLARLLDTIDGPDSDDPGKVMGWLARRIITTGSPAYKRAFWKTIAGRPLGPEETRALSLTGASGGFALVYELDPTIIPTSNFSVNPWRAISRIETIAGTNEWRGVTSGAITVARAAEGTEASDNAPTLAQPAIPVDRVQAFVPFSIEIGQDWGGMQAEMAQLLQDGKDDEEATSFATGSGTAPASEGIITGATTTVSATTGGAFAIADLYKLEEAVPPRFRPRSTMVMNRFVANKIRQFDTAGGSGVWDITPGQRGLAPGLQSAVPTPGNYGASVLGYGAYEASAMVASLTTGSKVIVMGDFRYFCIVDRVGMDIELIPHLFGAASRFPTGQRGLYAIWRNRSEVLSAAAFRVLQT